MAKKFLKNFFNLVENSKEFYSDFLNNSYLQEFLSEIYLEIEEFFYVREKYLSSIEKMLNPHLSLTEYQCIYYIGKNKEINLTNLAKQTKRTKGYISKNIKKLENLDFIEVLKKDDNKKEILIRLKSKGTKEFENYKNSISNIREEYFEFMKLNFNEEELENIYNFFIKINKFQNEKLIKKIK